MGEVTTEQSPLLAWVESCLPAATLDERLDLAARHDLALEVAWHEEADLEPHRRSGLPIAALQAWRLHDVHPMHPEREARREAERHVRGAVEAADRLGVRRIVTVCGYGQELADSPFERCCEFFDRVGRPAREHGVRLMVEPLSRLRAAAMIDPEEVVRLLLTLDQPDVFGLLLDTGHLLDGGRHPDELAPLLADLACPVEELQLRGAADEPPDPGWPWEEWWQALPEPRPAVISGEYRKPITPVRFEELVARFRELS